MKTFTRFLSLAIVGCGLTANLPANADTAYHAVYHKSVVADDTFSILDKYQNNVLTAEEYNNAALKIPFGTVDANRDGVITRAEFYAYYQPVSLPRTASTEELGLMMPAAGGDNRDNEDDQCRPQY